MKTFLPAGLAIAGLFLVSGCGFTEFGDTVRETVKVRGADAADTTIDNLEWGLCNAASIGSINRTYGTSDEDANRYRDFCTMHQTRAGSVVGPVPAPAEAE
ncbi:hypothetical protein HBA54_03220 [Pelagibius litoralis]|uniref:Lipoprotein n=1 Tax=Pelagibius litoralis TaxID=374515 RepID=A0A967EWN9_9PROT|nr:hypothetical protein [Pelagibius litoralis]NIA67593.1 hypothetical protein [Pelagibius litoralis]